MTEQPSNAMNADRRRLSRYLREHQIKKNPKLITLAGQELRVFFQRAEEGSYPLAPASELNAEKVGAAIAMATGREVSRVVFDSLLYCREDQVARKAYWSKLNASLEIGSWASIWDSLKTRLGVGRWASLHASLDAHLDNRLRASLGDSFIPGLGAKLRTSLLCYLGYVLIGNEEKMRRLLPLIHLLPHAIPLGEKADEPGTWIVLVA